jgi:hypothetical protein
MRTMSAATMPDEMDGGSRGEPSCLDLIVFFGSIALIIFIGCAVLIQAIIEAANRG